MSNLEKIHNELKEINGKLTMLVGLGSQLIELREASAKRAKEKQGLFDTLKEVLPEMLKWTEKNLNE